jgi:hypothetical protein
MKWTCAVTVEDTGLVNGRVLSWYTQKFWKRLRLFTSRHKVFQIYLKEVVCLFVCFESHEQFFSYLATVAITGDRAANLDLWLALTVFSSEDSFTCHTYCDKEPPFLRSYPKDPWFSLLNPVLFAKEQSLPIFNAAGTSGTRTHDIPFAKREHYH